MTYEQMKWLALALLFVMLVDVIRTPIPPQDNSASVHSELAPAVSMAVADYSSWHERHFRGGFGAVSLSAVVGSTTTSLADTGHDLFGAVWSFLIPGRVMEEIVGPTFAHTAVSFETGGFIAWSSAHGAQKVEFSWAIMRLAVGWEVADFPFPGVTWRVGGLPTIAYMPGGKWELLVGAYILLEVRLPVAATTPMGAR